MLNSLKNKLGFTLTPSRLNRTNYLLKFTKSTLIAFSLSFVMGFFIGILSAEEANLTKFPALFFTILIILIAVFYLIYITLLLIRRLHDLNHHGLWSILVLHFLIVMPFTFLLPGSKGGNKYGKPDNFNNNKSKLKIYIYLSGMFLTLIYLSSIISKYIDSNFLDF